MSKRLSGVQKKTYKETNKPTYQRKSHSRIQETDFSNINRTPSNYVLRQSGTEKFKKSEIYRNPSQTKLRNREEYVMGNIARRRNDNRVNNLKSQLQSLKMEVSRLVNKESDRLDYSKISYAAQSDDEQGGELFKDYGKQISDSVSVTSQKIIDEPIRRLQRQFQPNNYNHDHYLQLQNNLLKTELRNLKNKYNMAKQQWRQKFVALEKKNQYLEYSLANSEESLRQCKKELEVEVQSIKLELVRRNREQEDHQVTRKEAPDNELLQEKMNNMYEELSQKNRKINELNLELDEALTEIEKKKIEARRLSQANYSINQDLDYFSNENKRIMGQIQLQTRQKKEMQKIVQNLTAKLQNQTNLSTKKQKDRQTEQLFREKIEREFIEHEKQIKKLQQENLELVSKNKKIRQLNETHEQQIVFLKKSIENCNSQIEQLSANLRTQRQNSSNREEEYRKLIDDTTESYDKQIMMLKNECENLKSNARQNQRERDDVESKAEVENNDKQRQINRWKAQYRLLKHKFDQLKGLDNGKREQMEKCYKNFIIFEEQNKVIQQKNLILKQTVQNMTRTIEELDKQIILAKRLNEQIQIDSDQIINRLNRQNEELRNQLQQLTQNYAVKSEKLLEEQKRIKSLQSDILSIKNEDSGKFTQIIERLQAKIEDQDDKINKNVKQIKNKENIITKMKKEIRNFYESQEQQVREIAEQKINNTIEEIMQRRAQLFEELKVELGEELMAQRRLKEDLLKEVIKLKEVISQQEREIINLSQEIKEISLLYNQKNQALRYTTQNKNREVELLQNQLIELEEYNKQSIKNLQQEITQKQQQIFCLRTQNRRIYALKSQNHSLSFDQALRNQIEAVKKLQEEIEKKNEEIYKIKDSYSSLKTDFDNLKSETDIARLKFISEKKNIQINFDVEVQQLKSQLSTEQKKIGGLEQKIKMLIDENKKKDGFIQNYVMSRKIPTNEKEIVNDFLKNYEIYVTSKNISEKLMQESEEIERLAKYNTNLLKEIAQLREKLTMYEAISISLDNLDTLENQELKQSLEFGSSPQKKLQKFKSLTTSLR